MSQNSEVIAGMGTPPGQEIERYQIRVEDERRKMGRSNVKPA
jgi:hypothetical protein